MSLVSTLQDVVVTAASSQIPVKRQWSKCLQDQTAFLDSHFWFSNDWNFTDEIPIPVSRVNAIGMNDVDTPCNLVSQVLGAFKLSSSRGPPKQTIAFIHHVDPPSHANSYMLGPSHHSAGPKKLKIEVGYPSHRKMFPYPNV